jgi:hypothetical protein
MDRPSHGGPAYNRGMTSSALALGERITADLRRVAAERLRAVVVYGAHAGAAAPADMPVHVLAVVRALDFADLEALASFERGWQRAGLATPFVIDESEFRRSFDAFPIEFGAMASQHVVLHGDDPFAGLAVDAADLRRACEVQVRSHLLHLREGYLETGGDPARIRALVASSAAPLQTLLTNLAHLSGSDGLGPAELAAAAERWCGASASVVGEVLSMAAGREAPSDVARLFPAYLAAIERLAGYVDRWNRA